SLSRHAFDVVTVRHQARGIAQRSQDIFLAETGIGIKDLFRAIPCPKELKDSLHRNARTPNDRAAIADIWVNLDARFHDPTWFPAQRMEAIPSHKNTTRACQRARRMAGPRHNAAGSAKMRRDCGAGSRYRGKYERAEAYPDQCLAHHRPRCPGGRASL